MRNYLGFCGSCFKSILTGIISMVCIVALFIGYNVMALLLTIGSLLLEKKPSDCISSLTNGFITVCSGVRRQIYG